MPTSPEFWIPIGVSVVSLILASVALGWNIYRDVVLKARVRVSLSVVQIMPTVAGRLAAGPSKIRIMVTNHGPGPVQIEGMQGKMASWWQRLLRRPQNFVIMNDHTEPMNPSLPLRLDVGETMSLYLPHEERSFLSKNVTHIGVSDSFGRRHMAPKKDLRRAKKTFKEDFPNASAGTGG